MDWTKSIFWGVRKATSTIFRTLFLTVPGLLFTATVSACVGAVYYVYEKLPDLSLKDIPFSDTAVSRCLLYCIDFDFLADQLDTYLTIEIAFIMAVVILVGSSFLFNAFMAVSLALKRQWDIVTGSE